MSTADFFTRMWCRNAFLVLASLAVGCERPAQTDSRELATKASPAAVEPARVSHQGAGGGSERGYSVPERTEQQLAALLDATCAEAAKKGRPWLVEVTAPWCGDCRELARLETEPSLARELAEWPRAQVNIGNFDRHKVLRKWLDTRAIAQWSVLEGSECEPALGKSPVLEQRTLEPRSGVPVTAEALAHWLADARDAWDAPRGE